MAGWSPAFCWLSAPHSRSCSGLGFGVPCAKWRSFRLKSHPASTVTGRPSRTSNSAPDRSTVSPARPFRGNAAKRLPTKERRARCRRLPTRTRRSHDSLVVTVSRSEFKSLSRHQLHHTGFPTQSTLRPPEKPPLLCGATRCGDGFVDDWIVGPAEANRAMTCLGAPFPTLPCRTVAAAAAIFRSRLASSPRSRSAEREACWSLPGH